jgi:hypothetical protein
MSGDPPNTFAGLMTDAFHAVRALDGDNFTPMTARDGRRVYSQLLNYQKTVKIPIAEAALIGTALKLIWSRLQSSSATTRRSRAASHKTDTTLSGKQIENPSAYLP